ncbi:MAG TPA: hypothetical protein VF780_07070 [Nitrosospira sp.]
MPERTIQAGLDKTDIKAPRVRDLASKIRFTESRKSSKNSRLIKLPYTTFGYFSNLAGGVVAKHHTFCRKTAVSGSFGVRHRRRYICGAVIKEDWIKEVRHSNFSTAANAS